MAINTETTVRKLFTMPREMAERLDAYKRSRGYASEAEAMRALIEAGFLASETPDELLERCKAAHKAGKSLNWIAANILEPHPLLGVNPEISVQAGDLKAGLWIRYDGLVEHDITYRASTGEWAYVVTSI